MLTDLPVERVVEVDRVEFGQDWLKATLAEGLWDLRDLIVQGYHYSWAV